MRRIIQYSRFILRIDSLNSNFTSWSNLLTVKNLHRRLVGQSLNNEYTTSIIQYIFIYEFTFLVESILVALCVTENDYFLVRADCTATETSCDTQDR